MSLGDATQIVQRLCHLYDRDYARRWMESHNESLGGTPLELIAEGRGEEVLRAIDRLEDLLGRRPSTSLAAIEEGDRAAQVRARRYGIMRAAAAGAGLGFGGVAALISLTVVPDPDFWLLGLVGALVVGRLWGFIAHRGDGS